MKKVIGLLLCIVMFTGCYTHMTAVKWMHSQLSYCPPTGVPYGSIGSSSSSRDNLSYSAPSHKRKSFKISRSYTAPKSYYKNGRMKHYKSSLPKYRLRHGLGR